MAIPRTRETFKQHCLRRLGSPVIDINVDDDQLEDRIDEALGYYRTFHHDAVQKIPFVHQLTQTNVDNKYITLDNSIVAVNRVIPIGSSTTGSQSALFDLQFQIRQNDYLTYKTIDPYDMMLINQHLNMVDQIFSGDVMFEFNKNMDRLYLYWNWAVDAVVGNYIVIEAQKELDENEFSDIWTDDWLQAYTTALFKRQWGTNMKKYKGVRMLGGIELSGQEIWQEAMEEIKELETEMRNTWEEPIPFFTG